MCRPWNWLEYRCKTTSFIPLDPCFRRGDIREYNSHHSLYKVEEVILFNLLSPFIFRQPLAHAYPFFDPIADILIEGYDIFVIIPDLEI